MLLKLWRDGVTLAISWPEIELTLGAQLRMLSDHLFLFFFVFFFRKVIISVVVVFLFIFLQPWLDHVQMLSSYDFFAC